MCPFIEGSRTVQFLSQVELGKRGGVFELGIEVDEIVGLYLLQGFILDEFFKLKPDLLGSVCHWIFLLLSSEVKHLIILKMRRLSVRMGLDFLLATIQHEIEEF
jgi:hypothetical protein